ncbi:MAG: hypothetical protein A3G37_02835 [Omnitrophica WOR_2 bacterium RIFCSPLOWO2_12_FULL_46_30]|nr:MAG: hypothetical protein A3G37_02835 [Omnitrophica WOR_2 bacterium RIFCSPLOWO2_12_FULL_46_30]
MPVNKQNKYFYLLIVLAIMFMLLNTHSPAEAKSNQPDTSGGFVDPAIGGAGWVYEAKGKRDPFITLVTPDGRIIEPPKPKERTEGPPRLEGLMYDAKGISYVVMDGEVFRAGEMVGDYQLIRIDSNKVIMQKADQVFEVELTPP